MKKQTSVIDENLVAYCGLYCGSCAKFMKGQCLGCQKYGKATWCKIRKCNIENELNNCAHCNMEGIESCKKLNNAIGKVFEFVFKTDRSASLRFIQQHGELMFSQKMSEYKQMSIKKKQNITS